MTLNRRRVRLLALSTAILIASAVGAAWLLLSDGIGVDEIGVDEAEMALTKDRLGTLARGFDSVNDAPNARGRAANVEGCGTDSGDLFQPYAHREWQVSNHDVDTVAMDVVRRLAELGWRNTPELSPNRHPDFPVPSEPLTPDRFGDFTLSFEASGWSATAKVGPSFEKDSVFVWAWIKDATPCFWQ